MSVFESDKTRCNNKTAKMKHENEAESYEQIIFHETLSTGKPASSWGSIDFSKDNFNKSTAVIVGFPFLHFNIILQL